MLHRTLRLFPALALVLSLFSPQPLLAQSAGDLWFHFHDDGTNSTIDAYGSLDLSPFSFRSNQSTIETHAFRFEGNDSNWFIGGTSGTGKTYDVGSVSLELPSPYSGTRDRAPSGGGFSSNTFIRVNFVNNRIQLSTSLINGNTYDVDGTSATFNNTLQQNLNDDDFEIVFNIGASQTITFSTNVPPLNRPTGLRASAGNTTVRLNWTDPDNSSITKYQVRRKAGNGNYGNWTDINGSSAITTSHLVTGLTNGTAYTFQIRAVNAGGDSSEAATVTATPIGPPAQPTGLSATPGNTEVTLSWTNPNDSNITKYQVRRKQGNGNYGNWTDIDGSGATTSHTVTGLTNGTTYTFRIRAVNAQGNSAESAEASATPGLPPARPSGLRALAYSMEVELRWIDPGDSSITKYQVQWKKINETNYGNWTDIAGSSATTTGHRVTGLDNDTEYNIRIRAVNARGNSAASAALTVDVYPPGQHLNFMRDLETTAGDTTVTLNWTWGFPQNPPTIFDRYQVRWKQSGGNYGNWTDIAGSDFFTISHIVTGLTNNIEYTFEIGSLFTDGHRITEDATATPMPPPAQPTGLTATAGDTEVALSWTNPNNRSIARYQVRQKTGNNNYGDWTTISGSNRNTTSHTVTGLTNNTAYTFQVRAVNAIGDGAESAAVTATPATPPAQPTGLTATANNMQVALRWTDPGDNSITRYQVRQKAGSGNYGNWADIDGSSAATTRHTVTGLTNDTAYTFRIRAMSANTPGPESAEVTATPVSVAAPTSLTARASTEVPDVVTLTWAMTANETIDSWRYRTRQGSGNFGRWVDIRDSRGSLKDHSTRTHAVSDLPIGSSLTFEVRAVVDGVGQVPSPQASATPNILDGWLNFKTAGCSARGPILLDPDAPPGRRDVWLSQNGDPIEFGIAIFADDCRPMRDHSGADWPHAWQTLYDEYSTSFGPAPSGVFRVENVVRGVVVNSRDQYDYADGQNKMRITPLANSGSAIIVMSVNDYNLPGEGIGSIRYDYDIHLTVGYALLVTPTELALTEGGAADTFTVALSAEPESNVTVTVVSDDPGAAAVSPASLTFTPGNYSRAQTVTVTPQDDTDEENEQVTVALEASGAEFTRAAGEVRVTVDDDDGLAKPANLTATGGDAQVVLSWDDPQDTRITKYQLRYKLGNSFDATDAWTDMENSGASTTTHTVTRLLNNRQYVFQIRAATATLESPASDPATATPKPPPALALSDTSIPLTEGGNAEIFTAALTARPTATVTVAVASADAGAAEVSPESLTYTPNNFDIAQTLTVTPQDDADATDETTMVTLDASGAEYDDADENVAVTVDDDEAPSLTLTGVPVALFEGGPNKSFTVALTVRPTSNVNVRVFISDAGAVRTSGTGNLTFTPDNYNIAQAVTLVPQSDADAADERVTLTLDASGAEYANADRTVTVTVADDEIRSLALTGVPVALTEGGAAKTFTVALSVQPTTLVSVGLWVSDIAAVEVSPAVLTFNTANYNRPQTVTVSPVSDPDAADERVMVTLDASGGGYDNADRNVTVTVADDETASLTLTGTPVALTEGGAAKTFTVALNAEPITNVLVSLANGDTGAVTVSPATLMFRRSNYNSAQTVTVTPLDDLDASDERVILSLNASGGDYDAADEDVTVTVADDETISLTLTDTPVALTEGGAARTFTVALGAQPTANVTVAVASADAGAAAVSPDTLTFTPANYTRAQAVTVTPQDDDDAADESTRVTLDASGGGFDDADEAVAVTVDDDETATLALSPDNLGLTEGGAAGEFTVALSARPTANVTVAVASLDMGAARVSPETLTFTADNYTDAQTVTVTPQDDDDAVNESARVTLDATGAEFDDADSEVAVTVADDEGASLSLSRNSLPLTEGGAAETFTVLLSAQPTANVTVALTSADAGAAAVSPDTLTFTPDDYNNAQTVTVTPQDDDDAADETTTVTLDASGAEFDDADEAVAVTVADDETASLTLTDTPVALSEGGSAKTFTVALGAKPTANVTVAVTSLDTGAVAVSPGSLTFTPDNYTEAQTVTVSPQSDDDAANETTTVTLDASGAEFDDADEEVAVTVADDESASLTLTDIPVTLTEGGDAKTFTVALSVKPSVNVMVAVTSLDTSAAVVSPASLTFTPDNYSTAQAVTVTPVDDANAEDESTSVALDSSGAEFDDADETVVVTVTDDDMAALTITPTELTLLEGGTGTFTVALEHEPADTVTVAVSGAGDVSVSEGASLTFTLTDYATPQTVTLRAARDNDGNDDSVTVTLGAAGGGYDDLTGEVAVTVTDNFTQSSSNHPPILVAPIPDQTVVVDDTLTLDAAAAFRDADGDRLSYRTASNAPSFATVSVDATGLLTVTGVSVGLASVSVTVSDGKGGAASDTFTVTVVDSADGMNRAPEVAIPLDDQEIEVDETRQLDVSGAFIDADGDALTYTAVSDDNAVVTVAVSGNTLTLTGITVGVTNVTVTAADGRDGEASDTFTVTVIEAGAGMNQAPDVVMPLADQELEVDETRQLDVSGAFTDADGDALTYAAVSADESVVTVAVSGDTLTLTGIAVGTARVTVTASDGRGGSAEDTFMVTVVDPNRAPAVTDPLDDREIEVEDKEQVDVSGVFTDADGDPLTYTAHADHDAIVTVSVSDTVLILTGLSVGTTSVTLTAADGHGGTVSDTFNVWVTEAGIGQSDLVGVHEDVLPQLTRSVVGRTTQVLSDRIRNARARTGMSSRAGSVSAPFQAPPAAGRLAPSSGHSQAWPQAGRAGLAPERRPARSGAGQPAPVATPLPSLAGAGAPVGETYAETGSKLPLLGIDTVFTQSATGSTAAETGAETGPGLPLLGIDAAFAQSAADWPVPVATRMPSLALALAPVNDAYAQIGITLPLLGIEEVLARPLAGQPASVATPLPSLAVAGAPVTDAHAEIGITLPSLGLNERPSQSVAGQIALTSGHLLAQGVDEDAAQLSAGQLLAGNTREDYTGMDNRSQRSATGMGTAALLRPAAEVFEVFDTPGGWEHRRKVNLRQLLSRTSFVLPLNFGAGDGSGGTTDKVVTLWGDGGYNELRSKGDGAVDWDGGVASFHLGADMRVSEQALVGAALSRTEARFDYTDRGADGRALTGDYDVSLTGIHPYADWLVSENLSVWGTLGYAAGDLDLTVDEETYLEESDLELYMAALGLNGELYQDGAWQLDFRSEMLYAAMSAEDAPDVDVQRLRAVFAGSHTSVVDAGQFEQFAELGVRVDEGDGNSGAGLDLAGGLRYITQTGWLAQLRGGGLLANSDYREWQASALLEKSYQADGTGWMLRLSPHYSPTRSLGSLEGGAQRLWERNIDDMVRGQRSPDADEYQFSMQTELGYGLFVRDRLWTLYSSATGLGESSRRFTLGAEMSDVLLGGSVLRVGFEGMREESFWNAAPEHSLWLNLQWGYR